MEKVKHILLITAIIFIVVILSLSFKEIKSKNKAFKNDITIKTKASALLSDVLYVKTVKDFKEFEIEAVSAEYFKSDGISAFTDVNARFFSKEGSEYKLTGGTGTFNTRDDTILIRDDVKIVSDAGYEVATDTMLYSYEDKTLTTDDPVEVTKGGVIIKGVGMALDLMKEKININQKVKGHASDF